MVVVSGGRGTGERKEACLPSRRIAGSQPARPVCRPAGRPACRLASGKDSRWRRSVANTAASSSSRGRETDACLSSVYSACLEHATRSLPACLPACSLARLFARGCARVSWARVRRPEPSLSPPLSLRTHVSYVLSVSLDGKQSHWKFGNDVQNVSIALTEKITGVL